MPERRLVMGVIGHVDHGKTALVHALTGTNTDRLPEETRRGISIVLGFAHLSAPGTVIDLIDMPGHERFVRTMVSGATGIDGVLLVVAANEGVKPQTIEHLDIAGLLGVRHAILAISKTDLVAPDEAEAAATAARALAQSRGIEVATTLFTSAHTGEGVAALRQALLCLDPPSIRAQADGFPYLPIDRAFTLPGHGTIVTGTLRKNALAVSDELILVPAGRPIRLRALQVHGRFITSAEPGQRVAANLRDVEVTDIPRGAALTSPGLVPRSSWLTVTLRAVPGAPPLANTARINVLFGTEEVEAQLRLLDCDELAAGAVALAQLRCARPVCVPAREHIVVRRASPPQTLAGGTIIDPVAPRLRRHDAQIIARLAHLPGAAPDQIVATTLLEAGTHGVSLNRLAERAGLSLPRAAELLQQAGATLGRSRVAILHAHQARLRSETLGLFAQHDTLTRERLAALLPEAGAGPLNNILGSLLAENRVLRDGPAWRLYNHAREAARTQARLHDTAIGAARLAETLRQAGLSPPDTGKLAPDLPTSRLLDTLVREGVAVRATDTVQKRAFLFHQEAIDLAKRRLAPLLAEPPGLLVGEAGAALGISRKHSVPLLEHLDAIQFTKRVGDRRILARPA